MDFGHYVFSRRFPDLSHPPQILLYPGPGQIEGHVKMHHMTFSFKKNTHTKDMGSEEIRSPILYN